MNHTCPNPQCAFPHNIIRDGHFKRREDAKIIQRFRCKSCQRRFSRSTGHYAYRQKKRRLHPTLIRLLSSGVSLRRSALILRVNRKTIERKLPLLARRCAELTERHLGSLKGKVHKLQIDDLITKENSKLKPLSISIAVDQESRTILALAVSSIPAFGHLARVARQKYGRRPDEHEQGLHRLLQQITPLVAQGVVIRSDEHQRYPSVIRSYLPRVTHEQFISERSSVAGQGELKKVRFDPLFAINHTCAMLRANVNRLIRKTWCTTKRVERLEDHLEIYRFFHNAVLIKGR